MRRARGLLALFAVLGCRASPEQLEQWEKDDDGPPKLASVVHDARATIDSRRDAALALTRLVRRNRRVGLELLTATLADLPAADRANVIDAIAPALTRDTRLPRPAALLEQGPVVDETPDEVGGEVAPDGDSSLAAKDAVHALLARDLVSAAPRKEEFRGALLAWVQTSTLFRMGETRQRYSVEQSMRLLGAQAVKNLPQHFNDLSASVVYMASLIDDLGDAETKQLSARTLAGLAHSIASPAWLVAVRPRVEESNRLRRLEADRDQVDAQVKAFRDIRLGSVLVALSVLGSPDAIAELVLRASDDAATELTASVALIALKPHMRALDAAQQETIFVVAASEDEKPNPNTPRGSPAPRYMVSKKRNLAFACIEMLETSPQLIARLYAMFPRGGGPRVAAAEAVIARLEREDVRGFLERLGTAARTRPVNSDEALVYGQAIAKRFGAGVLRSSLDRGELAARLTAIAAFGEDQEALASLLKDRTPIPACEKRDDNCDRRCGDGRGQPDPATVGEFAEKCAGRTPRPPRDARVTVELSRAKRQVETLVRKR